MGSIDKAFRHHGCCRLVFTRIRPLLLTLLLLLLAPCLGAQHSQDGESNLARLPLQQALERAVFAFTTGDFEAARRRFAALEQVYGKEPEYQKPAVQQAILPARGHAALTAGDAAQAIAFFEAYLEKFPKVQRSRRFILYSLARAYEQQRDPEGALRTYARFENEFPGSAETAIATLRRAELSFEIGKEERAFELLEVFYRSDNPYSLRIQARLKALQKAVEFGNRGIALQVLLESNWRVKTMPELAVLTFAALEEGTRRLDEGQFETALRIFRLVPPKQILVRAQRDRLFQIEQVFEQRVNELRGTDAGVWKDFYRQLIARIRAQLENLEEVGDYTFGFYLKYGQAYLLAGRHHEAVVLFRDLARDAKVPSEIREAAHYRWILALRAMEQKEALLEVCRSFSENFPESLHGPDVVYVKAQVYEDLRRHDKAVTVLTGLLNNYPGHDLAERWLYGRGYNRSLLANYEAARHDFQMLGQRHPASPLLPHARMWHGLTWFFERNNAKTLEELAALREVLPQHPLKPEIHYWIAATHYANRDYQKALQEVHGYLDQFPMHSRVNEVRVLRGAILMGQGELLQASASFARVPPEAGHLFVYAVFQRGKIFKALEEYELMLRHFRDYVEREDVARKIRMAEALYWTGWAHTRMGDTAAAFPLYLRALDRHGNDLQDDEVLLVIDALARLHARYHRLEPHSRLRAELTTHPGGASLLNTSNFLEWIRAERAKAIAAEAFTYASRLSMYLSDQLDSRGDHRGSRLELLRILEAVPMQALDAQALGRLGMELAERKFTLGEDYLRRLLERFPRSSHRDMAYLGLAKVAQTRGNLTEARQYLEQLLAEMPLSDRAPAAYLALGDVLHTEEAHDQAIDTYEELLRIKGARGRPHAKALAGIARVEESRGNPDRAIPYWVRVYNLYRAYPGLVAEAYGEAARLLEDRGDFRKALRTWQELLEDRRLADSEEANRARRAIDRLQPLLPQGTEIGSNPGTYPRELNGSATEERTEPE